MLGVISNHYIAIYVSKNVYISADTSIQVFFTPKHHLRYVQKYLIIYNILIWLSMNSSKGSWGWEIVLKADSVMKV